MRMERMIFFGYHPKIKKNKPRKIIVLIDLKFLSEKRPIKGSRNASKIRTKKIISPIINGVRSEF